MTGKLADRVPTTMSSLINTISDNLYPEEASPSSSNIFTSTDSISPYSQMNTDSIMDLGMGGEKGASDLQYGSGFQSVRSGQTVTYLGKFAFDTPSSSGGGITNSGWCSDSSIISLVSAGVLGVSPSPGHAQTSPGGGGGMGGQVSDLEQVYGTPLPAFSICGDMYQDQVFSHSPTSTTTQLPYPGGDYHTASKPAVDGGLFSVIPDYTLFHHQGELGVMDQKPFQAPDPARVNPPPHHAPGDHPGVQRQAAGGPRFHRRAAAAARPLPSPDVDPPPHASEEVPQPAVQDAGARAAARLPGGQLRPALLALGRADAPPAHPHGPQALPVPHLHAHVQPQRPPDHAHPHAHGREALLLRVLPPQVRPQRRAPPARQGAPQAAGQEGGGHAGRGGHGGRGRGRSQPLPRRLRRPDHHDLHLDTCPPPSFPLGDTGPVRACCLLWNSHPPLFPLSPPLSSFPTSICLGFFKGGGGPWVIPPSIPFKRNRRP